MRKNAVNLSTWPFPAADHGRNQDQSRGSDGIQPAEQELVEEQMQRDRETAKLTSPPATTSQRGKG